MKQTLLFRAISITLLLVVLAGLAAACGDTGSESVTTPAAEVSTDVTPEETYLLREVDYNNEKFNIFNAEDVYSMIVSVTADEINGDPVNDAKFDSVARVERAFNVDIVEYRCGWDNMLTEMQALCLAGDHTYDVSYLRSTHVGSMIGQDYLNNLYDMEYINIEDEWWNQKLKDDATLLDSHLYYLVSDANLMAFEGTWCVYFNKVIAADRQIGSPYDLVRADMWTLDAMYQLAHDGASLNGDESFTNFTAGGNSVYGLASFKTMMNALMVGCNEQYCLKDNSDVPYYALGDSTTVYDVVDKITYLTSSVADGTFISANTTGKHYIADIFTQNRSLLMSGEIKAAATEMNEMTNEFGILPIPWYDEDQGEYYSNLYWASMLMTIPTTCSDVERASTVMDALSYFAYKNVLPVYYERVCYKGLKDADSVEMLEIISETRYLNWGLTYGWLSSVEPNMNTMLIDGNNNVASLIKSTKNTVAGLIDKTLDKIEK